MNNGVNAYSPGLPPIDAQQQQSQARDIHRPVELENREATQSQGPGDSKAVSGSADLSTEERNMIDRYFPASEEKALKIYGPGQQGKSIQPGAVGKNLDLHG